MGAGDNEWEPGSGHYPILSIAVVTAATWYQARVELDGSSMLRKVIAEKIESGASVL